jgi:peptide deformylase
MCTAKELTGQVRPILELGNPELRIRCSDVAEERFGTSELNMIVADMIATMRHANGAGIAANQIGRLDRIFVAHGTGANPRYPYKPKIPLTVFVNPVVTPMSDEKIDLIEGCLSVPGFRGQLQRWAKVQVHARRTDGSHFSIFATGHCAGTMQHECDHLDGVLFPDLAIKNTCPKFDGDVLMTSAAFEVPLVFEE